MTEWKFFPEGTVPECTTAAWYEGRERAPHLEQPGQRERLIHTSRLAARLIADGGITSVVDLGCGDGGLLSLLAAAGLHAEMWGYDVSPAAVEGARERGVQAMQLDIVSGEPRWGDLAVCTEMLEHQVDPRGFLRRVAEHSNFVIASSPYTENDWNHYEFHTWAWDLPGYRMMFEDTGWHVMRQETVQSFQIIAAAKA